uniref:Uncharacterized protein n=1 Tax=Jaculus jaculus TaxID=51337 RepID=A0A8C5L0N6_JACJA
MALWVFFFVILTLSSGSHCSRPPSPPLREKSQEQGARVRLGRQVDDIGTDQKQMALESILQKFPRMKPSLEAW